MNIADREQHGTITGKLERKSAVESLTVRFVSLIEEQAAKMTDEQFKAAEKAFNQVIADARNNHR